MCNLNTNYSPMQEQATARYWRITTSTSKIPIYYHLRSKAINKNTKIKWVSCHMRRPHRPCLKLANIRMPHSTDWWCSSSRGYREAVPRTWIHNTRGTGREAQLSRWEWTITARSEKWTTRSPQDHQVMSLNTMTMWCLTRRNATKSSNSSPRFVRILPRCVRK